MDPVALVGLSFFTAGAFGYVLHAMAVRGLQTQSAADQQRIRELELDAHAAERRFLGEINALESAHHSTLSEERGKLTRLRIEHADTLARERDQVSAEAREQARREFENQASLFSVSIRPYVRIMKDDGYFNSSFETQTGYQYQLLINGIPAFQPHIIVESTEQTKKFNDENLHTLIEQATKAAESAVALYIGKAGRHVNIVQALVERISR